MYLLQMLGRKRFQRAWGQLVATNFVGLADPERLRQFRRSLQDNLQLILPPVSVKGGEQKRGQVKRGQVKRGQATAPPGSSSGQNIRRALTDPEWTAGWQAHQQQLADAQIGVLTFAELPLCLQEIPDPPLGLYYRGDPNLLGEPGVAIVGARRCSVAGERFARHLAQRLSTAGLTINSGLALGIDGEAHRGALESGRTVAVLGGGLLRISPPSHGALARSLYLKGGLLVSEYSPTATSYPANFPERNRILSGISRAVVVVEAGLRSGSLITARLALEQGRDVLAVPGPIASPISAGCHRLLQQGAGLVTSAQDVADALNVSLVSPSESERGRRLLGANPRSLEARVFVCLQQLSDGGACSVDQLVGSVELSAAEVTVALSRLELAGFVQRVTEGYIPSPY